MTQTSSGQTIGWLQSHTSVVVQFVNFNHKQEVLHIIGIQPQSVQGTVALDG